MQENFENPIKGAIVLSQDELNGSPRLCEIETFDLAADCIWFMTYEISLFFRLIFSSHHWPNGTHYNCNWSRSGGEFGYLRKNTNVSRCFRESHRDYFTAFTQLSTTWLNINWGGTISLTPHTRLVYECHQCDIIQHHISITHRKHGPSPIQKTQLGREDIPIHTCVTKNANPHVSKH